MVLRHPYVTEKAMMTLEKENKLQFLVEKNATKKQIKRRSRRPSNRKSEESRRS